MAACTCLGCGGTFQRVPSEIAIGKGKFCSMACKRDVFGFRRQVRDALPGTVADIVERAGVSEQVARRQLVNLQKDGEAHASHLVRLPSTGKRGGCLTAIWYEAGPGSDPDVPHEPRAAHVYLVRKALLKAMPGTQMELLERIGSTRGSMPRLIAELHQAGRCYISSWKKGAAGAPAAVYSAGLGKDRKCNLVPLTVTQKNRRYKKRLEKRGLLDAYRARNAAQQRAVTLHKRGDPLINALFGKGRAANKETA